ncbi:MAG: AMP-binding enzyme, partial [Haliea sp.]
FIPKANKTNDYLMDRQAQKEGRTYSGVEGIAIQDSSLQESMGPIVDRTKDMIVTGGFNVYPREVEDVLSRHESVQQAVVIGVPDEQWGEAVKAVVVVRPGVTADDALAAALKQQVKEAKGSVQAPKSVDFVDAIPLTPVGKPDKKAVRARYWGDQARGVS